MQENQEEELYDEFGNYIGPDLDSDSSSSDDESSSGSSHNNNDDDASETSALSDLPNDPTTTTPTTTPSLSAPSNQIILHEDKTHYPSASTVYGPTVTTAVIDEDAMDISTPLVQPIRQFAKKSSSDNETTESMILKRNAERDADQIVSEAYLTDAVLNNVLTTHTRRGCALVGNLNSGKTLLLNLLHRSTLVRTPEERFLLSRHETDRRRSSTTHTNPNNHHNTPKSSRPFDYDTDTHFSTPYDCTNPTPAERARHLSLHSTPITLPLRTTHKHKTYGITLLDTPGHVQFHDEVVASLRSVDGAILVVDVVEGLTMGDEMALRAAIAGVGSGGGEGLPVCLVLNKVDRLVTELKLPVEDAYCKMRNVVEECNAAVGRWGGRGRGYPRFCPARGNVAFASALHGWCFTLGSFAEMYQDHVDDCRSDSDDDDEEEDEDDYEGKTQKGSYYGRGVLGNNLPPSEFAKRLWGDVYLCPKTRTFLRRSQECVPTEDQPSVPRRTFCRFVLEPIYKLYGACLGEPERDVGRVLRSVGVHLTRDQLRASAGVLLRAAFGKFFGRPSGLVDMIVQNVPSPAAAALGKISRCYTGSLSSPTAKSMISCNPNGPLIIHITKLYPDNLTTHDTSPLLSSPEENNDPNAGTTTTNESSNVPARITDTFAAFGRIYSGCVRPGQRVRVLGEAYSPEDDEDVATATVGAVSVPRGRFRTEVAVARAGNWVLLHGIDGTIAKTATVTGMGGSSNGEDDEDDEDDVRIFAPLKFPQAGGESVMKLSVEPLNPAELPKMVEGLRRISKSYPMARTRVEESGEHVFFGTGELYLDCVMHDLRHVYSDIEVKVADPVVAFRETVVETSGIKCFAETANKRNKLTMIAEPLDDGLSEQLESGKIKLNTWDNKKVGRYFQSKYDWDLLSARSVWAFGDSPTHGTNILLDDTLPGEIDKTLLLTSKPSIVQGFQWAMREGPLCEEPVRSTKLKILDVVLADRAIQRGAGQIIPTARKVVHSSLLTATPRLMEPVYRLQIQCYGDIVDAISPLLNKRRGHIVGDRPVAGSPLHHVKAFLPVIDSFGFETDIRTFTQGRAMVHSVFDHWAVVPGDPLDSNIILHPLEPSPPQHLARDFLIKTRGRKGLSEDVSLAKFFDEAMRDQL